MFRLQVIKREGDALDRAEKLQNYIERANTEMEELKEREGGAYEREDERDEKFKFLTEELHNKEKEAEDKERQVASLERDKERVMTEIHDVQKMHQDIHDQMDSLYDLSDDM